MTQKEFDAQMAELNYQQSKDNEQYNDKKDAIDQQLADVRMQILDLRMKLQQLHNTKMAVQSEQKRMNHRWQERKHEFVIQHPKETMEKEPAVEVPAGHAIHEEV